MFFFLFLTSNVIISHNFSPSTELLDRTNVVYMFKYPLRDCVSNENNTYVGLNTSTLSRRLIINLYDSSYIALHLKTHFVSKFKFRKILVENTTIIAHEINKLRLQILEALHVKTTTTTTTTTTTKIQSIELTLKIATIHWNAFCLFCFISFLYSISLDNTLFPLIAFCFKLDPSFIQLCVYVIL